MNPENILLLEKCIEGSLSISEAEAVYTLVSRDETFASELEQALDTEGVVQTAIDPPDVEALAEKVFSSVIDFEKNGSLESRVMEKIRKRDVRPVKKWWKSMARFAAVGAAAAVLIGAFIFIGTEKKKSETIQNLAYSSVHEMLADPEAVFKTGERIKAAGFIYTVAPVEAVDYHITTAGGAKLYALPDEQGRFYSMQWGWKKGEDITAKFKNILERDSSGRITHFCLDKLYRIQGSKTRTPDGFTLSAVNGGGFEITDPDSQDRILLPGKNNTFYNLTVSCSSAVPKSTTKSIFDFYSSHSTKIEYCSFTGSVGIWLDIRNSDDISIHNCHFDGGGTQVRLIGVRKVRIKNCLFENGHGDALRTERGSGGGARNVLLEDCYFRNPSGDAIGTPGGFKNSTVRGCVSVNCNQMIDLKALYGRPRDVSEAIRNENILIQNCHVINSANAFVFTTQDQSNPPVITTPEEAEKLAVQNVTFKDCVIENQARGKFTKFLLVKSAHSIRYENIRFLGKVKEKRMMNDLGIPGWAPHDVEGTFTTGPAGTEIPKVSFEYGPSESN